VREHASGGERGGKSQRGIWEPNKNGISYLDPAVLHGDQSSTSQSTNTFVMDGFKSAVLAAETLISFRNFLGVIHFPFDRKTKNTFADEDPGNSKPQLRGIKTEPPF
jgi:hypothetical protein